MSARIIGFAVAAFGLITDQALKLWLLLEFDLYNKVANNGPIHLTSYFDLILAWNKGVSFGLFQQDDPLGQIVLIMVAALAAGLLVAWIRRMQFGLPAAAAGLILGGAIGNAFDRIMHGAVVDLFHFYWGDFSWYVFNLADVWIVLGVLLLVYDSFFGPSAKAEKAAGK
ncbi:MULTISPECIES: signal peptidase II [Cohaesibacter]|uniref:signal peptidase II n=1 Tax=Cohaesibacter TaxID=655352 RepID=UPI000DE9A490|nr:MULTISPECIES: signal peptidase II [Cohaesibacter]TLP45562.1 signal peptidase II [Cohaesibacter sp. CAU 1516]